MRIVRPAEYWKNGFNSDVMWTRIYITFVDLIWVSWLFIGLGWQLDMMTSLALWNWESSSNYLLAVSQMTDRQSAKSHQKKKLLWYAFIVKNFNQFCPFCWRFSPLIFECYRLWSGQISMIWSTIWSGQISDQINHVSICGLAIIRIIDQHRKLPCMHY